MEKKYFINPGNEPTYITANWVQIHKGKLQFYNIHREKIAEFEIHEGLHFDDLNKE